MTVHSEKALETLRQMGCTTNGWSVPPTKWVRVKVKVPTQVPCPTCHGTGRVDDPDGTKRFARKRCGTCPPRRERDMGTGQVEQLVEREVLRGHIDWPKGTRFDSRFEAIQNSIYCQCALCAKAIKSAFSWLPIVCQDAEGRTHGMWVGRDCGLKILGVASREITMLVATEEAKAAKEAAILYKELPKPPKVVKPKPPALDNPTGSVACHAAAEKLFGAIYRKHCARYDVTRSTLSFTIPLEQDVVGGMHTIEVKVTARHGAVVKDYWGDGKPIWRDKTIFDVVAALEAALPAVEKQIAVWREQKERADAAHA